MIKRHKRSKERTMRINSNKPVKSTMVSMKGTTPMSTTEKPSSPKGYVKAIGAGSAKAGGRFVRVRVNGEKLLIPANDLLGSMTPVFARLQNHGASLIETKDQKDLHARIKAALQKEDAFPVATRTGWFWQEDAQGKKLPPVFVLPHRVIPEKWSPVEVHLDEPDNDCYQRIHKGDARWGDGMADPVRR